MAEKIKYSRDGEVLFYDEEHKYTDKAGNRLKSVTQTLHAYCNEFDPTGSITANFAADHDLSVEEVKEYWRVENKISTVYGSKCHLSFEDYINYKTFPTKFKYKWMVEEFAKIKFQGKIRSEALVYSMEHMLAGQVDLTENLGNKEISIWDFKTNKKLDKVSEFGTMMLKEFWYLSDCNFIHYELQLSLYAYLYELKGLKIRDLTIIYVNRDTKKLELHKCRYLKKEIEIIMKNRLIELGK